MIAEHLNQRNRTTCSIEIETLRQLLRSGWQNFYSLNTHTLIMNESRAKLTSFCTYVLYLKGDRIIDLHKLIM